MIADAAGTGAGAPGVAGWRRALWLPPASAAAVAALWLAAYGLTGWWLAKAEARLAALRSTPGIPAGEVDRAARARWRAAKAAELVRTVPVQFACERSSGEWINLDPPAQSAYILKFSLPLAALYGLGLGLVVLRWRRMRPAARGGSLAALILPPVYTLASHLSLSGGGAAKLLFTLLRPWDLLIRTAGLVPAEGVERVQWETAAAAWNTDRAVINWLLWIGLAAGLGWLLSRWRRCRRRTDGALPEA